MFIIIILLSTLLNGGSDVAYATEVAPVEAVSVVQLTDNGGITAFVG